MSLLPGKLKSLAHGHMLSQIAQILACFKPFYVVKGILIEKSLVNFSQLLNLPCASNKSHREEKAGFKTGPYI